MKRSFLHLTAGLACLLASGVSFAQPFYNAKNVDRTAMSFFDGQQTFRALEYTVNADPQSEKVCRLQTLPENGFPAITLQGISGGNSIYFEDKAQQDNQFTDNPTPYLSSEAVQTLYGFQKVMKEFDQRFGWKGFDGTGVAPIEIFLKSSDEDPSASAAAYAIHYKDDLSESISFYRSLLPQNTKPFINVLEVIAHEYAHAIFSNKTGIIGYDQYLCHEFRTLNEGIADILGLYVKNKIKQNSPQNYSWLFGEQYKVSAENFSVPKVYGFADTYNGEYYVNTCTEDYEPHPGSGVARKWFYLLSVGFQGTAYNDLGYGYGNLTGIGVENAIQIVWDAMPAITVDTDYPAFRTLTLQAAEKLYGLNSAEHLATQNAWCAVGVCDNNPKGFMMSPVNGAKGVNPWPQTQVSLTWENEPVLEWEVQMSTKYDFSANLQTYKVSNFTTVVNPKGGIAYTATVKGYYHPSEKVYTRARITQADPNFCRTAQNPLCALHQQFGPAHVFTLDNKQATFFSWVQGASGVNPWNNPTLTWKSVGDAQKYTFQVFNDKALTDLVYTGTTNHTGNFTESGVINASLDIGKNYYARVRAERTNIAQITDNFGAWSKTEMIVTVVPLTAVTQAKNQGAGDPAHLVSSMGFWVGWDPVPGAASFVVQIATDNAFANIIRTQTAAGNLTTDLVSLPLLPNQTDLFVRVLPLKGTTSGGCVNVWRVETDENAILPAMKAPADGSPIAYKNYLGATFQWKANTLNMGLVDHFELHLTEKTSNLTTVYSVPGKIFELYVNDQLMFDDKQGIQLRVQAVGPLGAKSALSQPFNYSICPDQPFPKFPSDIDKIDPAKAFTISWHPSLWLKPGDSYLVTILDGANPVPGFNNTPTTATSMAVPAGKLTGSKTYALTIKNQGACPGIDPPTVLFKTTAGGSNNPPATPTKNFIIGLHAFRNDVDPSDPFSFETSDYVLAVELFDPNGVKLPVADGNGNPVTQLLVDSENAILDMVLTMKPIGKYTLRLKMLNIFNPALYYPFDQPRFSVLLDGQAVVGNHIITADFINPGSPFNEWQSGFQFADIVVDVK
ncbi:M4 family metallopeptidase [Dyadobacter sp. 676]|uniref:M4 family metallopeptidase n=1 Tax=Dyadobacter sp. 676 TaxID=3088362 RepID=A0AAU8FDD8_9BACT